MLEQNDYEQLLINLEEERSNVERLIAWVKGKMAQQDGSVQAVEPPSTKQPPAATPMRFPRLAPDSFFRMTVPQAIKEYLNISKRPKTGKQITEALRSGGLTSTAKNLYGTVYPTLLRMEKAGEVVRVSKGEWGLSEWYPGSRKVSTDKSETANGKG